MTLCNILIFLLIAGVHAENDRSKYPKDDVSYVALLTNDDHPEKECVGAIITTYFILDNCPKEDGVTYTVAKVGFDKHRWRGYRYDIRDSKVMSGYRTNAFHIQGYDTRYLYGSKNALCLHKTSRPIQMVKNYVRTIQLNFLDCLPGRGFIVFLDNSTMVVHSAARTTTEYCNNRFQHYDDKHKKLVLTKKQYCVPATGISVEQCIYSQALFVTNGGLIGTMAWSTVCDNAFGVDPWVFTHIGLHINWIRQHSDIDGYMRNVTPKKLCDYNILLLTFIIPIEMRQGKIDIITTGFPYVAILYNNRNHENTCVGALISSWWILDNCPEEDGLRYNRVQLGSIEHISSMYSIGKVIVAEGYHQTKFGMHYYDTSNLYAAKHALFLHKTTKQIRMRRGFIETIDVSPNMCVPFAGDVVFLQKLKPVGRIGRKRLRVTTRSFCNNHFKPYAHFGDLHLDDQHFCVKTDNINASECLYSQALMVRSFSKELIGIMAWSTLCEHDLGVDPWVFTNVPFSEDWISDNTDLPRRLSSYESRAKCPID